MVNQRTPIVVGMAVAVVLAIGAVVAIVVLSHGGGVELPDEVGGFDARDSDAAVSESIDTLLDAVWDELG